jgi:hypothetical protein
MPILPENVANGTFFDTEVADFDICIAELCNRNCYAKIKLTLF